MQKIVKPAMFGNWIDQYGYPITEKILPFVARFPFITPNIVTITSFFLYTTGSLLLFIPIANNLTFAAILLPISYIGDQLDGQLARYTGKKSEIGDYLDKVLDVLKIYIIMMSLSIATYLKTGNVLFIFLGFTACFFFQYRYYIKLETLFKGVDKDEKYLEKSAAMQDKLEQEELKVYVRLSKGGILDKLKLLYLKNKIVVFPDEGEFAFFTAMGALFNRLDIALWFFAISQFCIAFFRFFQRGYQVSKVPHELLKPLRK